MQIRTSTPELIDNARWESSSKLFDAKTTLQRIDAWSIRIVLSDVLCHRAPHLGKRDYFAIFEIICKFDSSRPFPKQRHTLRVLRPSDIDEIEVAFAGKLQIKECLITSSDTDS